VKKKVVVLILALFMLMPVSGVLAMELNYNLVRSFGASDIDFIYDNNFSTALALNRGDVSGAYASFNFDEPVKITYDSIKYVSNSDTKINLIFSLYNGGSVEYKLDSIPTNIDLNVIGFTVSIRSEDTNPRTNYYINELSFDGVFLVPPKNVTNLEFNKINSRVIFSYDLPIESDFSHVKIYQDDVLIADNVTDTSYTVENLDYGKTYNFKFTTVDETGNESEGVVETVTIATPDLEEIKEVNAEASHDRIDLSWSLPETEYFEHVNIYRKNVSDVQTFSLLSVDEYDPLFETNGTYFNDLTVEEQTTYDYKLTTEFQGLESEGVTVQATTLVAPPPELGGQEFEEQENGDYLVTWQQPETGQVRILVDGQEYVVVPATDKQYTIPASDMKYSALGDPLVGLQTIGDNGEESEVEQQESNVNLPFGINELLTTSAGLLRVIGSLILLGLSFILVPKFIKVIKQSLNNKKNTETERTEREQRVSERAYREPRESRISTREGRTSTRVPREFRKGE